MTTWVILAALATADATGKLVLALAFTIAVRVIAEAIAE